MASTRIRRPLKNCFTPHISNVADSLIRVAPAEIFTPVAELVELIVMECPESRVTVSLHVGILLLLQVDASFQFPD